MELYATASQGTYAWSGPNGFTSNLQNPTIPSATVNAQGTYYITVSFSSCPSQTDSVLVSFSTIAINSQPTNTSVCNGDYATFNTNASGNQLSYHWQTNNGGWNNLTDDLIYKGTQLSHLSILTSLFLNGNQYRCIISSGCNPDVISDSALLTVTNPVTITLMGSTNFCNGSSVNLTASSGTRYFWNNGATTQIISASTSGSYNVTVDGCVSSTPVVVSVDSCPTIHLKIFIEAY